MKYMFLVFCCLSVMTREQTVEDCDHDNKILRKIWDVTWKINEIQGNLSTFLLLALFLSNFYFCFHSNVSGLFLLVSFHLMSTGWWWVTEKLFIKNCMIIKFAASVSSINKWTQAKGPTSDENEITEYWWEFESIVYRARSKPLLRHSRERVEIFIFQFIEHKLFTELSVHWKVLKIYSIFLNYALFYFFSDIELWKFPIKAQSLQKLRKVVRLLIKTRMRGKSFKNNFNKKFFHNFPHFLAFDWNENFVSGIFLIPYWKDFVI